MPGGGATRHAAPDDLRAAPPRRPRARRAAARRSRRPAFPKGRHSWPSSRPIRRSRRASPPSKRGVDGRRDSRKAARAARLPRRRSPSLRTRRSTAAAHRLALRAEPAVASPLTVGVLCRSSLRCRCCCRWPPGGWWTASAPRGRSCGPRRHGPGRGTAVRRDGVPGPLRRVCAVIGLALHGLPHRRAKRGGSAQRSERARRELQLAGARFFDFRIPRPHDCRARDRLRGSPRHLRHTRGLRASWRRWRSRS